MTFDEMFAENRNGPEQLYMLPTPNLCILFKFERVKYTMFLDVELWHTDDLTYSDKFITNHMFRAYLLLPLPIYIKCMLDVAKSMLKTIHLTIPTNSGMPLNIIDRLHV